MKKARALIILLCGIVLFIGSCAPFGYVIYSGVTASPSQQKALPDPYSPNSFTVQSAAGTLAKFSVTTTINTSSVQEDSSGMETAYEPRFRFPYQYRITDTQGVTLARDSSVLAWDEGSVAVSREKVTSTGGSLDVTSTVEKVPVPGSGSLLFEITFDEDTTYLAQLADTRLLFYENVPNNTPYVTGGIAMLIVGGILCALGLILLLISLGAGPEPAISPHGAAIDAGVNKEASCNRAMWIQLSAFLGYVAPFANIIAPLVLWLNWRKGDEYVDKMGAEAVNFNISVTIYYLISVLLMIIIIGFLLILAVMIYQLIFIIIAAIRSSNGEPFRYPLIIRLIKT